MQIDITPELARTWAEKMQKGRKIAAEDDIKRAQVYEDIARMLGFQNWDALSGILQREASRRTAHESFMWLKRPVTIYARTFGEDDLSFNPIWCKIRVDADFLRRLDVMRKDCVSNDPARGAYRLVVGAYNVLEWHEPGAPDGEFMNIHGEDLLVTEDLFWMRGMPKGQTQGVETRRVSIDALVHALKSRSNDKCFAWMDKDVLLMDPNQNVVGFAEDLFLDCSEITEEQCKRVRG